MKFKTGTIELPDEAELATMLEQPSVSADETELSAAKKAAVEARKRLGELSAICQSLPDEIIAGRARSTALEETIVEERSSALVLKAIEEKVTIAHESLNIARAESRDALVAKACSLLTGLQAKAKPLIPLLKAIHDLESDIEFRIREVVRNPETGEPYAHTALPNIDWPSCLSEEFSLRGANERAFAGGLPGGKFDAVQLRGSRVG